MQSTTFFYRKNTNSRMLLLNFHKQSVQKANGRTNRGTVMQLLGLYFTHLCSVIKTQKSSTTIGFDESLSTNFYKILETRGQ